MKTLSHSIIIAFIFVFVSNAHAYDLTKKIGLGVGAGYPIPMWGNLFNDTADPKYEASAFGRTFITSMLGVELGISMSKFKDTEWKFKTADLMALWRMAGSASLTPVMGVGAGLTDIDHYNPGSAKLSFLGRLGAEFDIGHSLSLGVLADYQYVSKLMGEMSSHPAHVVIPKLTLTWTFGATGSDGVHENKSEGPASPKESTEIKEKVSDVVARKSSSTAKTPDLIVYFDSEKAEVTEEFASKLKKMATKIKALSNSATIIEGHADSTGPKAYNEILSKKRALAVKRLLIEFGVAEKNLQTEGLGEDQPVASNKTKEGRAKNRRSALYISIRERSDVM